MKTFINYNEILEKKRWNALWFVEVNFVHTICVNVDLGWNLDPSNNFVNLIYSQIVFNSLNFASFFFACITRVQNFRVWEFPNFDPLKNHIVVFINDVTSRMVIYPVLYAGLFAKLLPRAKTHIIFVILKLQNFTKCKIWLRRNILSRYRINGGFLTVYTMSNYIFQVCLVWVRWTAYHIVDGLNNYIRRTYCVSPIFLWIFLFM